MNFVVKERSERIIDAIMLIIIGTLMCIFTGAAVDVFIIVSGVACLVFGVLYIVAYFGTFLIHDPALLLRGLFWILIGSVIMSDPAIYIYIVVFAVSFFLIYDGISEIAYAVDLAALKVRNWWVDLLMAILALGFGIAILVVEFIGGNSVQLVVILSGASLILTGVLELVLIFALHRDFKKKNDKVVSVQ
jgi:uncharacterized membrane protein HdeD (DUF308 family)